MNLTVGELKKKLAQLPDAMFIGKVGHFGEMHFMSVSDLYTRKTYWHTDKKGDITSWRSGHKRYEAEVLDICVPDIGPDPE